MLSCWNTSLLSFPINFRVFIYYKFVHRSVLPYALLAIYCMSFYFSYMGKSMSSSRWCFTSYSLVPPVWDDTWLQFLCYQIEVCPTTDRPHFQGYFETSRRRSMKSLKKLLTDPSIHLEAAMGSAAENERYCSKSNTSLPDTFASFGVQKAQGKRTDIAFFHAEILKGTTVDELVLQYPGACHMAKCLHIVQAANYRQLSRKLRELTVTYIWGVPGTGKSEYVYNKGDFFRPTLSTNNHFWFDGYNGEKILWLDDVNLVSINPQHLCHILDKYPLPIQTKGGTTYALWTEVFITSNFPIPHVDALLRRINFVHLFVKDVNNAACIGVST